MLNNYSGNFPHVNVSLKLDKETTRNLIRKITTSITLKAGPVQITLALNDSTKYSFDFC